MAERLYHARRLPPPGIGGISFAGEVSRTQQQFKDECDINSIMSRYEETGVLPAPGRNPPVARFGDFASAPDFMSAQNTVLRAREQFESLPRKVRERFQNDPVQFLQFVTDKANLPEARKLGLLSDEAAARIDAAAAPPPAPGEAK